MTKKRRFFLWTKNATIGVLNHHIFEINLCGKKKFQYSVIDSFISIFLKISLSFHNFVLF